LDAGATVVAGSPVTTVAPASKVQALLRLSPSSLFLFPHAKGSQAAFTMLTNLASAVPTCWLNAGTELEAIPDALNGILRSVRS